MFNASPSPPTAALSAGVSGLFGISLGPSGIVFRSASGLFAIGSGFPSMEARSVSGLYGSPVSYRNNPKLVFTKLLSNVLKFEGTASAVT